MFQRTLAVFLSAGMLLPAQQTTPLVAQSAGLKIIVIQGEGASNSIRSRSATAPVVEVRDDAEKVVANAEVTFQLPMAGPSAFFNGWLRNQTVRTDANGRASATGLTPNDEEGRFNIKVTAVSGTATTSVVIAQTNIRGTSLSATGPSKNNGWWKWAALAGAAAIGGGIYAGTRGGSSTPTVINTITISPGVIAVGAPR